MKHIIITTNDTTSLEAMQAYSGTELVKSDSDFAVWYCNSLSQDNIDAITGYNGTTNINLVGMLMLNIPQ